MPSLKLCTSALKQKMGANQKSISTAISSMIAVVVIIVIIIIAAGSLILFSQGPKTTSTATSSSTTTTISSTTSPTVSTTSISSSSSVSSISTSSLTSSSSYSGRILVSFADPNPPIIASNLNLTYTMSVTGLGNLPTSVVFSPISSNGILITFNPTNLTLSSQGTLMAMFSV